MATQPPVDALLQTKLYVPPLRPEQVPRPRLVERLDAGLGRKLTLARNIYGKLGVHNRTQAVVRARNLGLLPST